MRDDDQRIATRLRGVTRQADSIQATLTTNERVIARVTDGIYRQPGSAIRELIANAYDADATWVSVKTDAPRFGRVMIEDDGTGMTPEAVVHLLHNIGGSAKRTEEGQELGITAPDDPTASPMGRRLIGKLGIGIFSVSQLTHSFQIVTKTVGDRYRTVVLVNLRQFADEPEDGDETAFEAGKYQVWREPTDDPQAHGTTIVLTSIRPQTRDSLRSQQVWSAIDNPLGEVDGAHSLTIVPEFHIGRVDAHDEDRLVDDRHRLRHLPWADADSPQASFAKMVNSVWSYVLKSSSPKLTDIFDTYLQMLWTLALSLPLPYVESHVLDETVADDWAYVYRLSNSSKGSAERLTANDPATTIRQLAGLDGARDSASRFDVLVDGVLLSRPLRFRNLPTTQHVLKKPMVFVGHMQEDFSGFSRDVSAGPLEFDAYLFWTPKVAPTEHQGALVRIHGASGTLFDSTFFNYQVAELTRLRQVTCEIFVKQGLEAALNIDRESFNTAHPHTVLITRWVHSALRQLATTQKREAQHLREAARESTRQNTEDRVTRIVASANALRTGGEGLIPRVQYTRSGETAAPTDGVTLSFELERIGPEAPEGPTASEPRPDNLQKLAAITQLLAVYGLLDDLSSPEQENLLRSILGILEAGGLG